MEVPLLPRPPVEVLRDSYYVRVVRALACLSVTEDVKGLMVSKGALPTIFQLSRSGGVTVVNADDDDDDDDCGDEHES
jgi:hypothetical protein